MKAMRVRSILFGAGLLCFGLPLSAQEYGASEDEAFWTSDSLLVARIDSLGQEEVVREVAAALGNLIETYSDPSSTISYEETEGWVQAIRWAVILGDESGLALLDSISQFELDGKRKQTHYRLTYLARWGLYRLRSADLPVVERVGVLAEDVFSEDQFRQIFAEDRLMELGSEALPGLIAYAVNNLVPGMEQLDAPLTREQDLRFVNDYLRFTDFLRAMIATDADRALFEALRGDKNPQVRRFGTDVLVDLE